MATPALWVVVGPTASGKTELALRMCERLGGEIISADSVQVYRHFDIGSGKPSAEERARATHHLVDIVEPTENMDAAIWSARADDAIACVRARGRVPIVCGGTFLWVKTLLRGLAPAPTADDGVRAAHRALVDSEGRAALHAKLAEVDPVSAERLNPNDFVRVSRALEVFELSGKPMSQWQQEHAFQDTRYEARLLGVRRTPQELDARIRARAEAMLAAGWAEEVRSLAARGFADTKPMGAVGYKQVLAAHRAEQCDDNVRAEQPRGADVDAKAPPSEAELLDNIVRATRVFARRQRTWLRDEDVKWLDGGACGSGGSYS